MSVDRRGHLLSWPVPLVLMVHAADARTLPRLLSAVAITVCCTVMAGMWLRRRWPSRAQSQLAVVVGTACITLACLIQGIRWWGCWDAPRSWCRRSSSGSFISLATGVHLDGGRGHPDTARGARGAGQHHVGGVRVVLVALVNVFAAFACVR